MKKYFMIIVCLFTWVPVAQAVEITDENLKNYYAKGKNAFENKQWIDAIKYFFVYRELSAIGNAPEAKLSIVDGYIRTAEENERSGPRGPVNVIEERGGAGGGGTILERGPQDR